MDKNLLSRFQKIIEWKSVVKVALPAMLLIWVWQSAFSVVAICGFLAACAWGYITEPEERMRFRASFALAVFTALYGVALVAASGVLVSAVVLLFALALAFLFGVSRFFFSSRGMAYRLFHLALTFAVALLFFASAFHWALFVLLAVSLMALYREYFLVMDVPWRRRVLLAAVAAGFLLAELALMVRALPLTVVHAATFIVFIAFLLREGICAHFEGRLSLKLVLHGATLFTFVSVVIFALAAWRM